MPTTKKRSRNSPTAPAAPTTAEAALAARREAFAREAAAPVDELDAPALAERLARLQAEFHQLVAAATDAGEPLGDLSRQWANFGAMAIARRDALAEPATLLARLKRELARDPDDASERALAKEHAHPRQLVAWIDERLAHAEAMSAYDFAPAEVLSRDQDELTSRASLVERVWSIGTLTPALRTADVSMRFMETRAAALVEAASIDRSDEQRHERTRSTGQVVTLLNKRDITVSERKLQQMVEADGVPGAFKDGVSGNLRFTDEAVAFLCATIGPAPRASSGQMLKAIDEASRAPHAQDAHTGA